MLSINTNLSSLIVQGNLKQSTNSLNTAIERMTTGCKLNHASDNAANYNIATNMTTKLGALQVAEDNCTMGLDMLATANGTLDQIHEKLQRLRDLAVQSSNGTYGDQSKQAINAEANALVDEIERLYNTTEYNGINLMKGQVTGSEESNFIKDIDRRDTSKMTTLASVDPATKLNSGTYSISTPEELAKLATMTNNGLIGENCEFVLGADIDLSGYVNWEPIGVCKRVNGELKYSDYAFFGTFDGNGYTISGMNLSSSATGVGLFGSTHDAEIKNICLKDSNINGTGYYIAPIIGFFNYSTMENCQAIDCNITGTGTSVGGIVGISINGNVDNCITKTNVQGKQHVGGFCGEARKTSILNSFATGNVTGTLYVAGFIGCLGNNLVNRGESYIESCYTTGNVKGNKNVAGIVARCLYNFTLKNCYATGVLEDETGERGSGGLVGYSNSTDSVQINLENCYALGEFSGSSVVNDKTGLLIGLFDVAPNINIRNCGYSSSLYTSSNNANLVVNSDTLSLNNVTETNNTPFEISTISQIIKHNSMANLQIGTDATQSSQLELLFDSFLNSVSSFRALSSSSIHKLDKLLAKLSTKQIELGATENRLNSALEEISTQYENLLSSRSTIQDADIAEVSSEYIRQQILQQASATLMATANQTPAIALQLL